MKNPPGSEPQRYLTILEARPQCHCSVKVQTCRWSLCSLAAQFQSTSTHPARRGIDRVTALSTIGERRDWKRSRLAQIQSEDEDLLRIRREKHRTPISTEEEADLSPSEDEVSLNTHQVRSDEVQGTLHGSGTWKMCFCSLDFHRRTVTFYYSALSSTLLRFKAAAKPVT